jgi:hypothetical protein
MDTNTQTTTDNLPYYKFYVDSWLGGGIQGYDMETQGIFINLCSRAWKRGGWVEIDERLARLLHISLDDLNTAVVLLGQEGGPLISKGKKVSSKFILLQLDELKSLHQKRVEAGRKGGNTKQLNRASKALAKLKQSPSILDIDIDIDIDSKTDVAHGEFGNVKLTEDEYSKLKEIHGEARLKKGIEVLDDYIQSKGAKYKSHYAVLKKNSWVWKRLEEVGGSSMSGYDLAQEQMRKAGIA